MIIKKIFNNNVILTENEAGREIVAMGKGLASGVVSAVKLPQSPLNAFILYQAKA